MRTPNPELYERLAKPRPRAEAEAATAAFLEDVRRLREQYGIAELQLGVGVYAATDDPGKVSMCMSIMALGDPGDVAQRLLVEMFRQHRLLLVEYHEKRAAELRAELDRTAEEEP